MNSDPVLAAITARIRRAETARDAWRAAGNHEKYLESYFLAEALELDRERLRAQRVHSETDDAVAEPARPDAAQRLQMDEYAIRFDGMYCFGLHRYARLEDALHGARLHRAARR